MHKFENSILREYDIRGVFKETLTELDAYNLGCAVAGWFAKLGRFNPKIVVCFDGRLSSPVLAENLYGGLLDSGCEVIRVGRGPTPMLYYAAQHLACDGGIMVTGSHNPPNFNGFKLVIDGKPFYGESIIELGNIAESGNYVFGNGNISSEDIMDQYINSLLEATGKLTDHRVAWDPGNGAGGEVIKALISKIPGTHKLINGKIDGYFPAHHPDPTVPENLEEIIQLVIAGKYDLGLAFDGDADRIGVVDGEGRIIWGDQLIALLAQEVLMDEPGATIIADVKSSKVLFDEISRLGGSPLMWKTGHSCIKDKMMEVDAPLAGEMSGHIFFSDRWFGFDDAIYAALRVLSLLTRSGCSLASLYNSLPKLQNTPEIRFECNDKRKFIVIEEVHNRLEKQGARITNIDGVRVERETGWWLLRASNTQPVLVARCEATSLQDLNSLKSELAEQLKISGIKPPNGVLESNSV